RGDGLSRRWPLRVQLRRFGGDRPRLGGGGVPLRGGARSIRTGSREARGGERGVLHVKTPSVSPGHWARVDQPRRTFVGEWFGMSDIGRRDAEGQRAERY